MKILQIGKFFPPYFLGGIEKASFKLHHALQNREKIVVDTLAFLPKKYTGDIKVDEHIYLCKTDIEKDSVQFSKSFIKIYNAIKDNYDIIFINMPHPFANLVMWMNPPEKAKIVLYWHSDIIKQKFALFFYKPLLVWLIRRASLIIGATSIHTEQSDFAKYFIGKSITIPCISEYRLQKSSYKLLDGKKVIFSCGRLIYYKGFGGLIAAAKNIDNTAIIHIAGTGVLHNELQKQIDDNKLNDKVKLLGRLSDEDLQEEYKNCYLYCFPSVGRGEMLGLVQLEALSCGKPIVSCDIPRSGAPTLNIQGKTGFKVPVFNSIALAERINYMLNLNNIEYEQFCNNAVEQARAYGNPEIKDKYIAAFNKLFAN